jgi:hypothetical protein
VTADYPHFTSLIPAVTANRIACSMGMSMRWLAQESEKSRIGVLNFEPATLNS